MDFTIGPLNLLGPERHPVGYLLDPAIYRRASNNSAQLNRHYTNGAKVTSEAASSDIGGTAIGQITPGSSSRS